MIYTKNSVLFICLLFALGACTKLIPENAVRLLRKSNKIYDDNVNRKYYKSSEDSTIESAEFIYNNNNTLSDIIIFNDTTPTANLLYSISVEYKTNFVKLLLDQEISILPASTILFFDSLNRVNLVANSLTSDQIRYFYDDNSRIIKVQSSNINGIRNETTNYIYDANDNLMQFSYYNINTPDLLATVTFEYDYTHSITSLLDSRFYHDANKVLFFNGVNIIHLLGLNLGKSTTHPIIKRTEKFPRAIGDTLTTVINYQYQYNQLNEVIYRSYSSPIDFASFHFEYR